MLQYCLHDSVLIMHRILPRKLGENLHRSGVYTSPPKSGTVPVKKFWPSSDQDKNVHEWFRRNFLLITRNFTKNVRLINFSATQQFGYCYQKLKIAQIAQANQLFHLFNLVRIYGHGFYELSRMLMRKM